MLWHEMRQICLHNVVEWHYEIAENGNTQVENNYLRTCTLEQYLNRCA